MDQADHMRALLQRWLAPDKVLDQRPGRRKPWRFRASRAHLEEVAWLSRAMPLPRELETADALEALSLGHHLLELGRKEDGTEVTGEDVQHAGASATVVVGLVELSRRDWDTELSYTTRLLQSFPWVRIVKCLDRIAELQEARSTLDDSRWSTFVRETRDCIFPMAQRLSGPRGAWLVRELQAPIDARPPRWP